MDHFSVIVSFYKNTSKRNISIFFKSIERQKLSPNELIIVIDGPIDGEIMKFIYHKKDFLFKKKKFTIRLYQFPINMGAAIAYNKAVELSRFNLIIKCDADDFNYRDRFFKIINKLSNGFSLCGSSMYEYYDKKRIISSKPIDQPSIIKYTKYRNPFNNPTVGFEKKIFKKLGGYKNIRYKEDYILWIEWVCKYRNICNLDDVLVSTIKDNNFLDRRRGWINLYSELIVLLYIVKSKLNNPFYALIIYLVRSFILIMPLSFIQKIYINLLR